MLVLLIVSVARALRADRPRPVVLRRRRLAHAAVLVGVVRGRRASTSACRACSSSLTSVALIVALYLFFGRTLYGKALRATAVNRVGARLCGISPNFAGALTFTLAALLCAFCGVLIGPITTVYYDSGFLVSLKGFVGAIIGGLVELSAGRGGRAARRPDRVVRVVLGERVQGSDRLHADHPGAAVAQPHDAPSRGGGVSAMHARPRMRRLRAAFVAAARRVPLVAPQFWVTLGNYIGLYSIVALGLVLLTGVAGQTSFGQAAFVGLGAYTTAYLTTRYGTSPWLDARDRARAHAALVACASASSRCG